VSLGLSCSVRIDAYERPAHCQPTTVYRCVMHLTDATPARGHDDQMKQQAFGRDRSTLSTLAQILVTIGRFMIGCIRVLARYGTSPQTVLGYGSELERTHRASAWSRPPVRITFLPYSERRRFNSASGSLGR